MIYVGPQCKMKMWATALSAMTVTVSPCLAQNLDREVLRKPLLADHLSLDQGPSAAGTSAPSLQALSLPLPPCGALCGVGAL